MDGSFFNEIYVHMRPRILDNKRFYKMNAELFEILGEKGCPVK
jgi:hypothetical protein